MRPSSSARLEVVNSITPRRAEHASDNSASRVKMPWSNDGESGASSQSSKQMGDPGLLNLDVEKYTTPA
jgi:hypothetical protein